VCAAGGPLYVSSAASQAVQIQLDDGCLADDGMHLGVLADQPHPRLDAAVGTVAHTAGPPVVTETTQAYRYHLAGTEGPQRRIVLAHRDGQEDHLGPGIVAPRPEVRATRAIRGAFATQVATSGRPAGPGRGPAAGQERGASD
jgi:hypothetical protein